MEEQQTFSTSEASPVPVNNAKKDTSQEQIIKRGLIGLTSASIVLGVALLILGAIMVSSYSVYWDFITGRYIESAVFFLVVGIITIIVSSVGLSAALKSDSRTMAVFLSLMIIIVICEVITTVAVFAFQGGKSQNMHMSQMLKESLQMYGSPSHPKETDAWDHIQTELKCCGLLNIEDYENSTYVAENGNLPRSCCGPLKLNTLGEAEKCRIDTESRYNVGCLEALKSFLHSKSGIIGAMAVGVVLIQIFIIAGAAVLVKEWNISEYYLCYERK